VRPTLKGRDYAVENSRYQITNPKQYKNSNSHLVILLVLFVIVFSILYSHLLFRFPLVIFISPFIIQFFPVSF
jgi:hypothetical protein